MEPDNTKLIEVEANHDVGVIINAPHAGAPLVVAFSFVDWHAPGQFDFARRLMKLEKVDGRPLNVILVRDVANFWYQHGVTGLGPDVHTAAVTLRDMIARLKPSAVGTVGQSMGGYAAVLFGALLNVGQVLAFGALSYLRSDWARRDDDTRWLAVMEALDRHPPAHRYDDLPALLASRVKASALQLVYGTGPEASGPPNRDLLHAVRYAELPNAQVETIAQAPHAVVEWLIQQGRIDAYMRERLLDPLFASSTPWEPPGNLERGSPMPQKACDDGWRSWIAENLALGADGDSILATLYENGFHPADARREIYKAARSPYHTPLARLLERSKG